MPVVVVAKPKGGVGKSTLATNVAGYFASRGHAVVLGDADRPSVIATLAEFASARCPAQQQLGPHRRPYWQVAQRLYAYGA